LEALKTDPESRPVAAEGRVSGHLVRQQLFQTRKGRPYRMLFTVVVAEQTVRVLHVRGPGQDAVS
jgi:hypothetical protein